MEPELRSDFRVCSLTFEIQKKDEFSCSVLP